MIDRGGDRIVEIINRDGASGSNPDPIDRHPTGQKRSEEVGVPRRFVLKCVLGRFPCNRNGRWGNHSFDGGGDIHIASHVDRDATDVRCLGYCSLTDQGRHVAVEQGNRRCHTHQLLGPFHGSACHRDQKTVVDCVHREPTGRVLAANDLDPADWSQNRRFHS